jgi:exodeoxyribonuclease VII large subunit
MLLDHQFKLRRSHLSGFTSQLESLNPEAILRRGYAIVTRSMGEIVSSVAQVTPGDRLSVRVTDGTFNAEASLDDEGKG